jgi:1,4-alpha-glucan branching enzyme
MASVSRDFTADDAWAFNAGTHVSAYDVLGAHPDGDEVVFRVWAPDATAVSVVGDMNGWMPSPESAMVPDPSGVWRGRCRAEPGQRYKYRITPRAGPSFDKAYPYAFAAEEPPATASVVWQPGHTWSDDAWMAGRGRRAARDAPMSIYEVHLGSWRYEPGGYAAIARQLAPYAADLGFSHVEILPVTEHPFYGSWGYQTTGYFAPTARYGTPDDFMEFVDILHGHGIGVILDWVPSHFPDDAHGLALFDGTELYSHSDPRLGRHPDWDSRIFNYERAEVRSFLLSSAHYWIERFHIDALRVDAVASMLYLDYSRLEGEWIPNRFGGRENLAAISFLQELNRTIYERHPGVEVIAEESTAWPSVSRPVEHGGLGFGYKWDMGWMHDTLQYLGRDPVHRAHHHNELTFRSVYAFSENFVLPLSHDEVVHGKGSLLSRSPGDRWQQFATLRLLLASQWGAPGKKLLFMGGEFGQWAEWDHESELDWALLAEPDHAGVRDLVRDLNDLYRSQPALHRGDCVPTGFEWVVGDDAANNVTVSLRKADGAAPVLVVANHSPSVVDDYRIGVPEPGRWVTLLTSDDRVYGGSGIGGGHFDAEPVRAHGRLDSIVVPTPPLGVLFVTPERGN